jgi:phosphopantetheinyl transferase
VEALAKALRSQLTQEERLAARILEEPRDRHAFVLARALPRLLRSRYGGGSLRAHVVTGDSVAVCAAVRESSVGVGLEPFVDYRALDELVAAFMSAAEGKRIAQLDPRDRPAAFVRSWAAKEAVFAARNAVLHVTTTAIEVDPRREPVAPAWPDSSPLGRASAWSIVEATPAEAQVTVVAVEGPLRGVELAAWSAAA